MTKSKIEKTARQVVALLVERRFEELERLTKGVRLTAGEMARALEDYGRSLKLPPDGSIIDVIEVTGADRPQWAVRVPLWTEEEGESDLSLELTIVAGATEVEVAIDDIHVL